MRKGIKSPPCFNAPQQFKGLLKAIGIAAFCQRQGPANPSIILARFRNQHPQLIVFDRCPIAQGATHQPVSIPDRRIPLALVDRPNHRVINAFCLPPVPLPVGHLCFHLAVIGNRCWDLTSNFQRLFQVARLHGPIRQPQNFLYPSD